MIKSDEWSALSSLFKRHAWDVYTSSLGAVFVSCPIVHTEKRYFIMFGETECMASERCARLCNIQAHFLKGICRCMFLSFTRRPHCSVAQWPHDPGKHTKKELWDASRANRSVSLQHNLQMSGGQSEAWKVFSINSSTSKVRSGLQEYLMNVDSTST